ncbi:MAG: hypothetical protein LBC44_00605 [Mycoplasmataceae bacterium]|jgi:hypothetical protein|nr:hypothetical protein [Mycoplasmataceae bacterium]
MKNNKKQNNSMYGKEIFLNAERMKKDFSVDKDGNPSFSSRLENCINCASCLFQADLNNSTDALSFLFRQSFELIGELKEDIEKFKKQKGENK